MTIEIKTLREKLAALRAEHWRIVEAEERRIQCLYNLQRITMRVRNLKIVAMYEDDGLTLKEVGRRFGITGARVRDIVMKERRRRERLRTLGFAKMVLASGLPVVLCRCKVV